MKFTPHPEKLLGFSFWQKENNEKMLKNREQVRKSLKKELSIVQKRKEEIQQEIGSLHRLACTLGLIMGIAIGTIPWIILIALVFILNDSIINNIIFMTIIPIITLILGLLLATITGRFMYYYIIGSKDPSTEKELKKLVEKENVIRKNMP